MAEDGKSSPFTDWNYDYKDLLEDGHIEFKGYDKTWVYEKFKAAKKDRDDYDDAISKFLAYKIYKVHYGEHECAWPSRAILKSSLPQGWKFSSMALHGGEIDLPIRYDAMNSFVTTFNFSLSHINLSDPKTGNRVLSWGRRWSFTSDHMGGPASRNSKASRKSCGYFWTDSRSLPTRLATSPTSRI